MRKYRNRITPGTISRAGLVVFTLLFLILVTSGCMQPAATPSPATDQARPEVESMTTTLSQPAPVMPPGKRVTATATKPDSTKILITYRGGPDADSLMELETTIIDDRGTIRTRSMGSRLGTTPTQTGGTDTFYGPFTKKTHVMSVGYFSDGTHQDILDIWI